MTLKEQVKQQLHEATKLAQRNTLEGIDMLQKILVDVERTKDDSLIAQFYSQLSNSYFRIGDLDQGLDYSIKSLPLYDKLNDQHATVSTLIQLAGVNYEMSEIEKSLEYLEQADAINAGLNNRSNTAKIAISRSIVYSGRNRFDEAFKEAQVALKTYEELGDKTFILLTKTNMCVYLTELKDYKNAEILLNETMELATDLHDERGLASILITRGQLYLATNRPELALESLTKGLERAEKATISDLVFKIHDVLRTYYRKAGNFEKALEHFELYHNLEKASRGEALRDKVSNMEMQMELVRKEKQLEVERAQHKEELARQRLTTITALAQELAHDVQNPIQFVNNFSEMNIELLEELNEAITTGNGEDLTEALESLSENIHLVKEHGNRLSTIVDKLLDQTRWGIDGPEEN